MIGELSRSGIRDVKILNLTIVRLSDPDIRIRKKAGYPEIFGSDTGSGSGYPKLSVRISDPDPDIRKFRFGYRIRISEDFGSDPRIRKNGRNPNPLTFKLQKISPAALKNERNLA